MTKLGLVLVAASLVAGAAIVPANAEAPAVAKKPSPEADMPPPDAPAPITRLPVKPKSGVSLTLASVTLADDCGPPPSQPGFAKPPGSMVEGARAPADIAPRKRACEQSSMHLVVESAAKRAMPIRIQRVELLDASGKFVQALSSRKPTKWSDDTSDYAAWDQVVPANAESFEIAYHLSAPAWHKLGGRSRNRMFQVRVTVSVGGYVQRLQYTAPAAREPAVPT